MERRWRKSSRASATSKPRALLVLRVHGGIYADLAARFAAPMSTLFRTLRVCTRGFIAARPNSPRSASPSSASCARGSSRGSAESTRSTRWVRRRSDGQISLFFRGAGDSAAFVPGDYGTHRTLNFENPRVVDERGAVVVWKFKFE